MKKIMIFMTLLLMVGCTPSLDDYESIMDLTEGTCVGDCFKPCDGECEYTWDRVYWPEKDLNPSLVFTRGNDRCICIAEKLIE